MAIGIAPLLLFGLVSVGIWNTTDKAENHFFIYLISGIIIGTIIDGFLLKKYVTKIYEIPLWILAVVYLLLNIGVFGFFMGFPVFNLFCGLLAGFYYGKRMVYQQIDPDLYSKYTDKISWFTTITMSFICLASALIALSDKYITGNVQGMLNLDTEPSQSIIWLIILLGGFFLIAIQYFITKFIIGKAITKVGL